MALINRSAVAAPPELKREIKEVDELGGEIAIVELDLTGRLLVEEVAKQAGGGVGAVYVTVPHVLAACVLDAEDEPIMTAKQWRAFGGRHRDVAIDLFNIAMRLSGFDGEAAAKN